MKADILKYIGIGRLRLFPFDPYRREVYSMGDRYQRREITRYERIQSFALVWMEMYKNRAAIPYAYFEDIMFIGNGLEDLGFTMDSGESIKKAFPDKNALYSLEDLRDILDKIDLETLGNAIYSKWRYFNHWSESAPDENDYEWFIIAFKRLAELAGAMDPEDLTVTARHWDESLTDNSVLNHYAECKDCIFRDETSVDGKEYGWMKCFCKKYGGITLSRLDQIEVSYIPEEPEDKPRGVYEGTEPCKYYESENRSK